MDVKYYVCVCVCDPLLFPSRREPGSGPLRSAPGERPGDLGPLQVPGEGQQAQRGAGQRLPHPVVSHQLPAQEVRQASLVVKDKVHVCMNVLMN